MYAYDAGIWVWRWWIILIVIYECNYDIFMSVMFEVDDDVQVWWFCVRVIMYEHDDKVWVWYDDVWVY